MSYSVRGEWIMLLADSCGYNVKYPHESAKSNRPVFYA